jgi:hypothetical protein
MPMNKDHEKWGKSRLRPVLKQSHYSKPRKKAKFSVMGYPNEIRSGHVQNWNRADFL